jgi:phage tail sheath protein FI
MASPHGVVVTEGALGAPPISLPDVSNIGIIGTAPEADVDGKFGENGEINYNQPFLITSRADAAATVLGEEGTLPNALDAIFAQTRAKVVFVIVEGFEDGEGYAAADRSFIAPTSTGPGSVLSGTAASLYLSGDEGLLRIGGSTTSTPTLAQLLALAIGQEITIEGSTEDGSYTIIGPPVSGTNHVTIPVREETATDPAIGTNTLGITVVAQDGDAKIAAAALGDLTDLTGVHALISAESEVGVRPNLILSPDIDTGSGNSTTANALGAALNTVAGKIRAIALIAGPNTTHAAAITDFAVQYGGDRTYLVDPYVKVADGTNIVNRDATPFIAGVIVKNDAENGWWRSPSNKLINGVLGTARPIDFVMGDAASRAQLMNDVGIATVVNISGGYRLWGNETPASGDRLPWKFLNVRRIADVLYKAIQDNHLWAVDRGITRTYFDAVSQGVNSFIKTLISQEALIAGECFPDGDLNTAANIANGEAHFNVRYTPVYPAQTVSFKVDLDTTPLGSIIG